MKRIYMLCAALAFLCAAGFSESDANTGDMAKTPPEYSVLNLNLLIYAPGLFDFSSYQRQNCAGVYSKEWISHQSPTSHQKTNALQNSFSNNNKSIKQHRFWRGSASVFAGMLAACIATDAVYLCEDDVSHKNAVVNAASSMDFNSDWTAILSGNASTARCLISE